MTFFPPAADSSNILTLYWPLTTIELLTLPVENILPIALIFATFVSTSFFGGFAEILTQRVLIDVIPNKIRNSMYSLFPTLATIFAIPQIAVFGWLITIIGFPLTLASCGVISFLGVVLIIHGFRHDAPEPDGETWANGDAVKSTEETKELGLEEIAVEIIREANSGGIEEIDERILRDD
jgi:hypothetical protein